MPLVDFWLTLFIDGEDIVELYSRVVKQRGMVTDFVFQLTIRNFDSDESDRRVIRRYDCADGFPHCDVYNAAGTQIRKEAIIAESLKVASNIADHEVKVNARRYLAEYRASQEKRR